MYFVESPQIDAQELSTNSLQALQEHYSGDGSHYSLRHTLSIIAETLPQDEELSEYLHAFHADGRIVSYLQLRDTRPAVSEALAESLYGVSAQDDATIRQVRELEHVQDPKEQPLRQGINFMTVPAPYDLTWPAWSYKKAIPINHPCGTESWPKLRRSAPHRIGQTITQLAQATNDNPDIAVAQAAVRLVCSKKTAPHIDGQTGHMAILTAPKTVPKAQRVLRMAGASYARGAVTIANALARADEILLWDTFYEQARTDFAELSLEDFEIFEGFSLANAIGMAMRARRYDVAYSMSTKVLSSSINEVALRALATIVNRAHAEKSLHLG